MGHGTSCQQQTGHTSTKAPETQNNPTHTHTKHETHTTQTKTPSWTIILVLHIYTRIPTERQTQSHTQAHTHTEIRVMSLKVKPANVARHNIAFSGLTPQWPSGPYTRPDGVFLQKGKSKIRF